jgi:hypothetical protein
MTPFTGYIFGNTLTVVTNAGPISPGLIRSTNFILPNTNILECLTGNGRPFTNGSTWRLDQTYATAVGNSAAPVQMFLSIQTVPRYAFGFVYDLPQPDTNGNYTMVVQLINTNERENQNLWSSTATNLTSLNSSGQLATHFCIGHDLEKDTTPSGQDITPFTWVDVYNPPTETGVQNTDFFENKKMTQESSSVMLIIIIIIIVMGAVGLLLIIMLFRKNGLLKKMNIHKNLSKIKEANEITVNAHMRKHGYHGHEDGGHEHHSSHNSHRHHESNYEDD